MNTSKNQPTHSNRRLSINVDLVAIALGITLAVLVRFNVIHQISF